MKLSQMDTNKVMDALVILAPEIETLMNDGELAALIQNREVTTDREEAKGLGMKFMLKIAVYLLKNQRECVLTILGALNDKTAAQLGKQLFPVTLGQIVELLNDKELMGFFTQFGESEQAEPSE